MPNIRLPATIGSCQADPPTAGDAEPLGYLVKRLHQALRGVAEEALRGHQLGLPQLSVLAAVGQSPGVSNAALARASFMTPPSMVELLAGLEQQGLVRRRRHPAGGRVRPAELTPRGLEALRTCQAALQGVEARLLAGLTPDERALLRGLLVRCLASLQEPAAT
jgi:DNA-binding MarR family transcriptional regulator